MPQQLTAYLTAAALGAASAMVYDLLRTVRLRRRRDRRLTGLLDVLYTAVLGLLLLWFALRIGQGELRLYMLTGVALGAAVAGWLIDGWGPQASFGLTLLAGAAMWLWGVQAGRHAGQHDHPRR